MIKHTMSLISCIEQHNVKLQCPNKPALSTSRHRFIQVKADTLHVACAGADRSLAEQLMGLMFARNQTIADDLIEVSKSWL